jgi:carbon monoxide dehydrogenase subunit G
MPEAFEQSFELEAEVDLVWAHLIDPYQVVGCLPGAAITGRLDERTYTGSMSVKLGLVTAAYSGKVTFERVDPVRYETEVVGTGQDGKGKGGASMRMVTRLRPSGRKTLVAVVSDVHLTGIFAQMGRGIIQSVAQEMVRQFATRLVAKLDQARPKYAEVVKAHAQAFVKIYPGKLEELQALAGIRVAPDGTNAAASAADVVRYVDAVRQIGGDVAYTSARLTTRGAAQREQVPLPKL